MEANWAAQHLQTIRTLMERSAVYRRALAPIMTYNGAIGIGAAVAGWAAGIDSPRPFILYWAVVAAFALGGSFLLVRKQALKEAEAFWSPPTRRVAVALLPALFFGFVLGLVAWIHADGQPVMRAIGVRWMPLLWAGLYGCGLHAAGFFMPRGMKIFAVALLLGSATCCLASVPNMMPQHLAGHVIMGSFFGAAHLAYGIYLYFTEKGGNET